MAASFGNDDGINPFASADGRDPLANLTIVLAVRLDNPQWRYSTKDVLGDDRARELVRRMVIAALPGEIRKA